MYHLFSHNDLDGVGCGIIAKLAFGNQVTVSYNSITRLNHSVANFLDNATGAETVIITDLSVNEENEKKINEYVAGGGKALLIDHHKSALHLNEHSWAAVTVEQEDGKLTSATSLLYDYLAEQGLLVKTKSADEFVELVRQYDTWEWDAHQNFMAKQLNDLFFMISIEEFEEKIISKLEGDGPFRFDEIESKLLHVEESRVTRYINRKKREVYQLSIGDHLAGVVHAENYHSELGNELSKEFTHLDYIAMVMVGGKRISLRTIHDDVDVSEIAARYDGGGHQKASGCNLTEKAFKQFVERTFNCEPLKRDAFNNQYNLKGSPNGSFYKGKNDESIFVYQKEKGDWKIKVNQTPLETAFPSFEAAEKHIKKEYFATLVRDIDWIDHLLKFSPYNKK